MKAFVLLTLLLCVVAAFAQSGSDYGSGQGRGPREGSGGGSPGRSGDDDDFTVKDVRISFDFCFVQSLSSYSTFSQSDDE